jgi:hypothetical protein
MRIEQALALRDRGVTVLCDCYSIAKTCGLTSADMETRKRESLSRLGISKAPQWVRSYLDGYWRAVMAQAYRFDLVFGAYHEGRFYSNQRKRADYYETAGLEPRVFAEANPTKGHYWTESLKPFFVESES